MGHADSLSRAKSVDATATEAVESVDTAAACAGRVYVQEIRPVRRQELEWVQELCERHDVQVPERLLLAVRVAQRKFGAGREGGHAWRSERDFSSFSALSMCCWWGGFASICSHGNGV